MLLDARKTPSNKDGTLQFKSARVHGKGAPLPPGPLAMLSRFPIVLLKNGKEKILKSAAKVQGSMKELECFFCFDQVEREFSVL